MEQRLDIDNPFGGPIWYRPNTESTMIDAEALIARGELPGCIALSAYQTAGRGRFSTRRWEAQPGEALLFTLVLPPALAAPGKPGFPVSLLLALGLASWLEALGLAPAIKWPNDVLVNGHKIAGILVTGSRGLYHAGIGLNLAQRDFDPATWRRPATSLAREGHSLAALDCLPPLLAALRTAFDQPDPRQACENRLWQLGKTDEVTVTPDSPPLRGRFAGLDGDGTLLLDTPTGRQRCLSGE